MKSKYLKQSKSFTLIEIMIAVTIFVIVCVLVIASLSILVNSKSKTVGLNELRTEGGKIMIEIQDMVEKGNGTASYQPGVIIENGSSPSTLAGMAACTNVTGNALASFQTDYKQNEIRRIIWFDNTNKQVKLAKRVIIGGNQYFRDFTAINSDRVTIDNFTITGTYRSAACVGQPITTTIKVSFKVVSKAQGTPSELELESTFTSNFPYPDQGADSVPPVY